MKSSQLLIYSMEVKHVYWIWDPEGEDLWISGL
jgi:hypothetical protein